MKIYVGVMSGTSLDGIDVALVAHDFVGTEHLRLQSSLNVITTNFVPYDEALKTRLSSLRGGLPISIEEACRLHSELGMRYADAVELAIANSQIHNSQIDSIGLHGQTVWHAPPSSGSPVAGTLQLGQPAILAERLGIPVVSDFRARDIAAGGEGAPLVPFADYTLLSSEIETRVVLNIGGIANVTYLPKNGRLDSILAFDTGPGNMLIDALTLALTGQPFDSAGTLAARGVPDDGLLNDLLAFPYFHRHPPKTTGAELFGPGYSAQAQALGSHLSTADFLATATALTVHSIAEAIQTFLPTAPDRIIVGGGGVHNRTIMSGLRATFAGIPIDTHEAHGIPSDFKEAIAFAILAAAHRAGIPANVPRATGAKGPRILGSLTIP